MPIWLKEASARARGIPDEIRATVSRIISEIEKEGEAAVRRYSRRFDDWDPPTFRVSQEEIERAYETFDPEVRAHAEFTLAQVRAFADLQRHTLTDFEIETMPGVLLGQRHIPVASVGAYSPGVSTP